MPFIGIVSKENDSNFIKNQILKSAKLCEFEIININEESVVNIKNIKFETIIINDDIEELLSKSKYLEELMENAKYIVVNSDIVKDISFLDDNKNTIITYGLNQNAIVTISSIKEDKIMVCLQKSIKKANGENIEEQEKDINIKKNNMKKVCNLLAVFTILKIYE